MKRRLLFALSLELVGFAPRLATAQCYRSGSYVPPIAPPKTYTTRIYYTVPSYNYAPKPSYHPSPSYTPSRSSSPSYGNGYSGGSRSSRSDYTSPTRREAPAAPELTPAEGAQRALAQMKANSSTPEYVVSTASLVSRSLLTTDQKQEFYANWLTALAALRNYEGVVMAYEERQGSLAAFDSEYLRQLVVEACYHTGRYARAVAVFATPKPSYGSPPAYYSFLLSQLELGYYDDALAGLPRYATSYGGSKNDQLPADYPYQLARCRLFARQGTPAQRVVRQQLAIDGFTDYLAAAGQQTPRDARTLRALAYYSLEDYPSCVADLTEDLQVNPHNTTALYWRAAAHTQLGQYASALVDENVLLGFDDKPADNWNSRARTRCLSGDFAGGLADTREALHRDSTSAQAPRYLGTRGYARAGLGRHAAAIGDYTRVLRTAPSGLLYLLRGQSRLALGQTVLARADFVQALMLGVEANPRLSTADAERGFKQAGGTALPVGKVPATR